MAALDPAQLLVAYDSQLRARVPERRPPGLEYEWDGPVLRFTGFGDQGWVLYRDLGGLEGSALDELIERQVRVFAERGERFEWKYHGHDRPADLPERLRRAGFETEDLETIVIARVADIAGPPSLPEGVTLRDVTERADLERIAAMEAAVWGDDHGWLPDGLGKELAADPDGMSIVVAEADGVVVCAAWIRYEHGTDFATLWGGATLPDWRGRGIYKATVAHRAGLAAERGFSYLEVDASDDSRPILERLGFVPVTTTTPFVWSPA
jgi:GNAT superfamily N-acetyltransferase